MQSFSVNKYMQKQFSCNFSSVNDEKIFFTVYISHKYRQIRMEKKDAYVFPATKFSSQTLSP